MKQIEHQTFDQERALYGIQDTLVTNCTFDGPADGESAFKECRDVEADHCFFNLRYPFWHDERLRIVDSEMTRPMPGGAVVLRTTSPSRTPSSTASRPCGSAARWP